MSIPPSVFLCSLIIYVILTDVTHKQDIYSLFDALRQNRPKKRTLMGVHSYFEALPQNNYEPRKVLFS
jgi:hypothetical protein